MVLIVILTLLFLFKFTRTCPIKNISVSYYFVLFHIFAGKPRRRAQKQGLYRRLCARLADEMAVSPQDVMVVIQFNQLEDWSFSAGRMAIE